MSPETMTQNERLGWMIHYLAEESGKSEIPLPNGEAERFRLLRVLMNVRHPRLIDETFLEVQDAYLQEAARKTGIVKAEELPPVPRNSNFSLWRGDITTLAVDAIVNAANSQMLGCFVPCHGCIDNAIHTYAGVQLRLECDRLMREQGHEEPAGAAKITPGYNLPCRHVIHTVGPIVSSQVTKHDEGQLASCYRSCLALAVERQLGSIAFCCISTGEFHFPQERAAKIAVETVADYLQANPAEIKVIFNVFKESDHDIYNRILGIDSAAQA